MEGKVLDPYEQQLFSVFESCDECGRGYLDRKGLEQLCEKLQLEEQSVELINCLLEEKRSLNRVTFPEFKDGLLAILGERQKKNDSSRRSSPDREVSPKYVFGQKKYGRRSRPDGVDQSNALNESDDSDSEILVTIDGDNKQIVMRSASEISDSHEVQLPKKRKTSNGVNINTKWPVVFQDIKSAVPGDDTAPSSLGASEEEVLRNVCENLGIGHTGFLDRKELYLVCQQIGLDSVADEVVQQLFTKLNVEHNGMINFEEFLRFFHSGTYWMTASSIPSVDVNSGIGSTKQHPSSRREGFQQHSVLCATDKHQSLDSTSEKGFKFLALDSNNSGLVPVEAIIELWETAGLPSSTSTRLVRDLGFSEGRRLRLVDLVTILESELPAAQAESLTNGCTALELLLHATLALYQAEVRCLRLSLEHMSGERDKLRGDILDANERASLLAQEIDDHHARLEESSHQQIRLLEQRHAEQLKSISEQLTSEREHFTGQVNKLEKKLAEHQEDETKLRVELSALKLENEAVDKENQNLLKFLEEANKTKVQLLKEVENLAGIQQKLSDYESNRDQMEALLAQVNKVQLENTELRDSNDELKMKIEALTVQMSKLRRSPSESFACDVTDGGTSLSSGTKRRGDSPMLVVTGESSEEESPRLGKIRKCNRGNSCNEHLDVVKMKDLKIRSCKQTEEIKGLEDISACREPGFALSHTGSSEIIEDSNSETEEEKNSCYLKITEILRNRVAELEERLKKQNNNLEVNQVQGAQHGNFNSSLHHDFKLNDDQRNQICAKCKVSSISHSTENFNYQDTTKEIVTSMLSENKSSEHLEINCSDLKTEEKIREELIDDFPKHLCFRESDNPKSACDHDDISLSERCETFKIRQKLIQLEKEHSELKEHCSNLEASLEQLRQEYECCEDYWTAKLDEERRLAEQEQLTSDEKFSELLAKIREYEELCVEDGFSPSLPGRLPTIEERAGLEKQVTDLEEECEALRLQSESEQAEKEKEISNLKSRIEFLEKLARSDSNLDAAVQVSDMEIGSCDNSRTVKQLHVNKSENEADFLHRELKSYGGKSVSQACCIDVNVLHVLNDRLRQQEHCCQQLQLKLKQQQQRSDSLLQKTWQQHKEEIEDLQHILHTTQQRLIQQTSICKDQTNRLASSDLLVKDLYIENAYLIQTIQRLEQRCHTLIEISTDSSSV